MRAVARPAVIGLVLACGGQPAPPPAPPTATPIFLYPAAPEIVAACARHADAYCSRLGTCMPSRLRLEYGTPEHCRARRDHACRVELLDPARGEGAGDRMVCGDALAGQSCRDFFLARPLPACTAPAGHLAAGASCAAAGQCAGGLLCRLEPGGCGRCEPALGVGADCGWWRDGCAPGTSCFADRCVPPLAPGQACKSAPAACRPGDGCTAGGCVEKAADRGSPCTTDDLCDPWKNLHCNLLTGTCEYWAPQVPFGQPCGAVIADGSVLTCSIEATCFGPSLPTRVCVPRAPAGQPCDPAQGKECLAPGTCVQGVCLVPAIVDGGSYVPPTCR